MNRLEKKKSTFNDQQKTQLLELCTRYRSVFSLNQEGLERCKIAEAEFPLQKNSKQVDRHPYRTIQEHKKLLINLTRICNQSALSRRTRAHRRCLYAWLPQLMAPHVFVSITGLLLTSSLSERHGQCPILSLISTQWVVRNHHRVRHSECLLANTYSEGRLSQNSICNLERQTRFQGPSL